MEQAAGGKEWKKAKNSARFRFFPLDRERVNERPRLRGSSMSRRTFNNICPRVRDDVGTTFWRVSVINRNEGEKEGKDVTREIEFVIGIMITAVR